MGPLTSDRSTRSARRIAAKVAVLGAFATFISSAALAAQAQGGASLSYHLASDSMESVSGDVTAAAASSVAAATPDPIGDEVTTVVLAAARPFRHVLGGVHWSSKDHLVEVMLSPPTAGDADDRPAARAAIGRLITALPAGVSLEFVDVPYSFDAQANLVERVADTSAWVASRVSAQVRNVNVNPRTGAITVMATGDVAELQALGRQRYGADFAVVVPAGDSGDILQGQNDDASPPIAVAGS